MTTTPPIPGWYGKLPTLGDFASRRLDASFIDPWDAWLAEGLAALRAQSGDGWLAPYLASPVWRFVLMPDTLPGMPAMAGVLMPSVDRVGRYFPLTLAAPLPDVPSAQADTEALLTWLHQLDDAAADALHEDWTVEQLEAELERLPPPCPVARPLPAGLLAIDHVLQGQASHARLPLGGRTDLLALLGQGSAMAWQAAARGLSFWWAESAEAAPRGLVSRGLPRGDGFAALLGGAAA